MIEQRLGNMILVLGWQHPERSRISGGARNLAANALSTGKTGKGTTSVVPFGTATGAALAAAGDQGSRFTI